MDSSIPGIIVATDFSEDSHKAALRGVQLMQQIPDSQLVLTHVLEASSIQSLMTLAGTDALGGRLREQAQQLLLRQREALTLDDPARVRLQLLEGDLLQQLLAASASARVTILGARGSHPLRSVVLGSTAQRFVYRSKSAALIVRKPVAQTWQRVVVATDFSAAAQRAVKFAAEMLPSASLTLLHAYQAPYESSLSHAGVADNEIADWRERARARAQQSMQQVVEAVGLGARSPQQSLVLGNTSSVLIEASQQPECDLLVVGKQGQSMAADLLMGGVTQHLLNHADCDLLIVP